MKRIKRACKSGREQFTMTNRKPPIYSTTEPEFEIQNSFDVHDETGSVGSVELGRPLDIGYESLDVMLPYDGKRGVVHRSAVAKTGMLVGRTEEDEFVPRPVGHESGLERATAVHSLIHPNTRGLKCQPRKVVFDEPVDGVKSNTLDYLLTLKSGERYYLFVKNEESLGRAKTALICERIRLMLPAEFGFAPISEVNFPPQVRGNNDRMFLALRFPDVAADHRLHEVLNDLIDVDRFTVEELIFRCDFGPKKSDQGRGFDAVLRAIAGKRLIADRRLLIHYPTVLGVPS
jgi:hypothetical protein